MKLRNFLNQLMTEKSINQMGIAKRLNKSPQLVSMTLSRDIKNITVSTLLEYTEAVGKRINFQNLLV